MPLWSARWRWIDPDALTVFATGNGGQGFALARAGDAFAVLDQKQRAMGGALDKAGAAVEKLVGQPLQRDAAMGAAIVVDKHLSGPSHDQQLETCQLEAAALSFRNSVAFAQVFQRGPLYA